MPCKEMKPAVVSQNVGHFLRLRESCCVVELRSILPSSPRPFPIFDLSSALARLDLLPQTTDTTKKNGLPRRLLELYEKHLEYCKRNTVSTNLRSPFEGDFRR